jgi:membrane protein DedA with SNARE-associated domain
MIIGGFGIAAFVGVVFGAGVFGYLFGYRVGRRAGKRDEQRYWERRIAGDAREVDRTLTIVRHALEKDAHQSLPNSP